MNHCEVMVKYLYEYIIEDVIKNCRDSSTDDGIDDQVLDELKKTWHAKVNSNKAVRPIGDPTNPLMPSHSRTVVTTQTMSQSVPIQTPGGAIEKKGMDSA